MAEFGLFRKYLVAKADGSELEPEAKYFVIRYDAAAKHGSQGRAALKLYSAGIKFSMPDLAEELLEDLGAEAKKAFLAQEES